MRATVAGVVLVLVLAGCGQAGEPAGAQLDAPEAVPTIHVSSPQHGATVELPFTLQYEVRGFELSAPPGGHLHIIWGDPETDVVMVFPESQSGGIEVDGVPEGTHDLTIALANEDHSLAANLEAAVTLEGITVTAPGPPPAPDPEPAAPPPAPAQAPPQEPAPQPQAPQPAPTPAPPPPTPQPDYGHQDPAPGVPGPGY